MMLETIIDIIGNQFQKKKHFPSIGNRFFRFSCQKKQFFCIEEMYFSTNASFRVVKTYFLASTNHLYIYIYIYFFFQRLLPEKDFFLSSGNLFLNESFILAIGEGFFSAMKTVTLLESFFLLVETITVMSGNQFLKTELILSGGN